jgi:hypothetical protein
VASQTAARRERAGSAMPVLLRLPRACHCLRAAPWPDASGTALKAPILAKHYTRLPVENFNNLALFILRRHRQLDIQELLWTDSFATNFGSGIRCDPNQKYRQGK